MRMVMCRSCGHFQPAARRNGTVEPIRDECEKCASVEFVDTRTDHATQTRP